MVEQLATELGPIYSLAISSSCLVCLASWSVLTWSLDSCTPGQGTSTYQGSFPDLPPAPALQSWLEHHSALLSSSLLVTRAARLPSTPGPPACYIHLRSVGTTGEVRRQVLAPWGLLQGVVEVGALALSGGDLLASLVMVMELHGMPYVYQVRIHDCWTGALLASLPSQATLGPVKVREDFIGKTSPSPDATLLGGGAALPQDGPPACH